MSERRCLVIELLINKFGEIEDYSLNYPHFKNLIYNGKHKVYGIIDLIEITDKNSGILPERFRTADEAEDYLLDFL